MNNHDEETPSYQSAAAEGDFYMDERGWRVMTATFHRKRGYCCGSGCRHCPYFPRHAKGSTSLE
ncbi:DUF5522 domain-containing protein [Breznakibacter xylanolyticus]|uniref:DUF5522 domain-containing protein n=1 Tax=Breznakibacter xylanolyticus TaxID=990 RepID=UPI000DAB3E1D|nr:DUF5522 domain-containing protein [Breznakibacter xylanolyticus]